MPDGTRESLVPSEPHNDLAGFESGRRSFYGSDQVRALGLVFLPTLAHQDIYASDEDLAVLEYEARLLLESLHLLGDAEYWRFRLSNILEAVRLAKAVSNGLGVVYIG